MDKSEQALLNEYKGNIFEYLVGNELAKSCDIEEDFVLGITDEFRTMFAIQERFIRSRFNHLLVDLPVLAKATSELIRQRLGDRAIKSIKLVGKSNNLYTDGDSLTSADLILHGDEDIPLSLKLSKDHAFVNTRSGGIKSFFNKYFDFSEGKYFQQILNSELDKYFEEAMIELHERNGLEYTGSFDHWIETGKPELPGQLEDQERQILFKLYNQMAIIIQDCLLKMQNENPEEFAKSIHKLIGLSNSDLMQVICFYKNKNEGYELDNLYCEYSRGTSLNPKSIIVQKEIAKTSSFEILMPHKILQIRVKPMNKFTAKAFKINCSVKYVN